MTTKYLWMTWVDYQKFDLSTFRKHVFYKLTQQGVLVTQEEQTTMKIHSKQTKQNKTKLEKKNGKDVFDLVTK